MKYSMFYASVTGNTKMLADAVEQVLAKETKTEKAEDADLVCVGFWTNEGTASEEVRNYLKTLYNRKIFLFGTAGFGDSKTYLDGILEHVEDNMNDTNEVVSSFMCQGKMPEAVGARFEAGLRQEPENEALKARLENFRRAMAHPNRRDLEALREAVKQALSAVSRS